MAVTPIRYVVEVDTKNGLVKIDGLTKGFVEADVAAKKLNATIKTTAKNAGQMRDKTGLAGAAVVEIGRTISDANYGLTAMANNISQLSTLMVTLIATSGGVVNGMKALWAALRGPLGVIVVFQIIVAVLEKFAIEAKKAGSEANATAKAFKNAATELELLLKLDNTLTDQQIENTEIRIKLLKAEAEARAQIVAIQKLQSELVELELKETKDLVPWYQALWEAVKTGDFGMVRSLEFTENVLGIGEANRDEQRKNIEEKIAAIVSDIDVDAIRKITEGKGKLGKNRKLKKVPLFSAGLAGVSGKGNPLLEAIIGTSNEDELARSAAEAWKGIADAFAAGSEDESVQQYWFAQMEARKDFYIGMIMPFYNQSVDLLLSRYDREAVIEQNATNQKNNALRDRLRNENLSADERKRIQLKISRNDEALRVEQEKIAEKRFNAEKAANIVTAIVETYVAANKALAQFGGAPFGIGPMAATIALGLANVATIASQKFQTSASTAPTAGDLGVTQGNNTSSITPNFNIVGDTGINQLRDTIMGVVERPVKTYITGKDVRTSEELERNIIRGSTLGG